MRIAQKVYTKGPTCSALYSLTEQAKHWKNMKGKKLPWDAVNTHTFTSPALRLSPPNTAPYPGKQDAPPIPRIHTVFTGGD